MATSKADMNNNRVDMMEGEDHWEDQGEARENISPVVGRGECDKSATSRELEGKDQVLEVEVTSPDVDMEEA